MYPHSFHTFALLTYQIRKYRCEISADGHTTNQSVSTHSTGVPVTPHSSPVHLHPCTTGPARGFPGFRGFPSGFGCSTPPRRNEHISSDKDRESQKTKPMQPPASPSATRYPPRLCPDMTLNTFVSLSDLSGFDISHTFSNKKYSITPIRPKYAPFTFTHPYTILLIVVLNSIWQR